MVAKKDRKLAELILYVSERCEQDQYFGATKLNKILFYADFLFFQKTGRSITGQEYRRLPNGPAPKRLVPVRQQLDDAGDLAVKERHINGLRQVRTLAIREPDLSGFDGDEIAMVDYVITKLWNETAAGASDLSHGLLGWKLAEDSETIPYETVFLSERKITREEADYALQLIET
jgi:Protein of unknown function (DUF4065)